MKETLQSVKKIDWLICIMAIWIFTDLNFNELSTMDTIYLVTFSIWSLLFIARLVITYRNLHKD